MYWTHVDRKSYLHVSTHQTYIGKALYEHARECATIAAVACMSSSLLKSSLGPNLLALISIDKTTVALFDKIFLEYNPHMQLTQAISMVHRQIVEAQIVTASSPRLVSQLESQAEDALGTKQVGEFLANVKRMCDGRLFESSLQRLCVPARFIRLFADHTGLRELILAFDEWDRSREDDEND